ncbi:M23 family metallopeptidase [Ralstonia sp. ASV6]|uniref:M23 family metallopeptidase n=1 Tax=Ralstonia sp. ASV6 TaxID=2795124 RepID=UPI0018EBF4E7|nr:M23 family metallopeptidase [Ralstonia sp. ASV6]
MIKWSHLAAVGCAALVSTPALAQCLADPVDLPTNTVTSVFGKTRSLPQYKSPQVHWGTDFQARDPAHPSQGAKLKAVDNGTVIGAGFWGSGYGNRVALKRSNGDIVLYNHLASVEPKLKSGGAVGFRETGGSAVGNTQVSVGDLVGVAGGTGGHMDRPDLPVHLHLEYVTNYAGTRLRETNDGTNQTRSRYLRNAVEHMCRTPAYAAGAGTVTQAQGGSPPAPSGPSSSGGATAPDQSYEAVQTQPTVTPGERYGIPDAPPYQSYEGMSESQIVDAEMTRRALDTEWEEHLTGWSQRGLMLEIARIAGARLWLNNRIAEKRRRIDAMQAILVANKANKYVAPQVTAAYQRVTQANAGQKVSP